MPVRSRVKLLAGLAALVGLSVAGTGCQSSPVCKTCNPVPCESCTTATASLGRPITTSSRMKPLVSRPLMRVVGRPNTREPMLAQPGTCSTCATQVQATPCTSCGNQSTATVLRPVPVQPTTNPGDASSWTPVQRVSGESTPGVFLDRPQPVAFNGPNQPEAIAPLTPVALPNPVLPLPSPTLAGAGEKGGMDPEKKDDGMLPLPKKANGKNGSKSVAGYPEIPAPVITHPPQAPREFSKRALSAYIVEPPDILSIETFGKIGDPKHPITGPHLVRMDGTIGLGSYGAVFVAGMTIDQAKLAIVQKLRERQPDLDPKEFFEGVKVDVAAYNSKFYYVITDGGGYGEQVYRVPCTGNEMVLDALAQIQGLPAVASKKRIWLARATPNDHIHPIVLPIDWDSIVQRGSASTNYQVFPGDRIYVNSDKRIRVDSHLAKFLAPIERLFGTTLLGASTVNAIRNGNNFNNANR